MKISQSDTAGVLSVVARWGGWLLVVWVIVFWRLGYPSFWDPGDEAHYAQATREMLLSNNWLAPMYNGEPFFDKPPLFYILQMLAFKVLGPTELAARMVPAVSAVGLFIGTWWIGVTLFDRRVAIVGTLMLALLPGTFALSSYAILDMTFTAFLFSGLGLVAAAALRGRPRLEYPGYALIALAVLTKGPLAIALAGLTFVGALVVAPEARRPLLRLHWARGLGIILAVTMPWFFYMWWRFGGAFIEGYLLRENVWLFTRGLSDTAPSSAPLSYLRVITMGLLPWTPVLAGRIVDVVRGDRASTEERLLWVWSVCVVGFFSLSSFKLDHYIYPAAPALSLLAAQAWNQLRTAGALRPHAGTAAGCLTAAVILVAAGVFVGRLLARLPAGLPPAAWLVPIAFVAAGLVLLAQLVVRRFRPPAMPLSVAGAMLVTYAVVLVAILPGLERAKVVKDLGQWVAARAPVAASVGSYRMERWTTSWRFYADRPVEQLETADQFGNFLRQPGQRFCLMLKRDADLLAAAGQPVWIAREAIGLFTTSGRALSQGTANWQTFVVVSNSAPH